MTRHGLTANVAKTWLVPPPKEESVSDQYRAIGETTGLPGRDRGDVLIGTAADVEDALTPPRIRWHQERLCHIAWGDRQLLRAAQQSVSRARCISRS